MKSILIILMMLTLSLMVGNAHGAKRKVCNDLKVSQCKKRTDCSWIQSKSKSVSGKKIKNYCRKNVGAKKSSKKRSKKSI